MSSDNELTRRDFATTATGAISILGALSNTPLAAQTGTAAATDAPHDLLFAVPLPRHVSSFCLRPEDHIPAP